MSGAAKRSIKTLRVVHRGLLDTPTHDLCSRKSVELPGSKCAMANRRSPHDVVVRFLDMLSDEPMKVEATGPFTRSYVRTITYEGRSATQATREALDEAIVRGFLPSDIALLTFNSRDKSLLVRLDQLGLYASRSFTGDGATTRYSGVGSSVRRVRR